MYYVVLIPVAQLSLVTSVATTATNCSYSTIVVVVVYLVLGRVSLVWSPSVLPPSSPHQRPPEKGGEGEDRPVRLRIGGQWTLVAMGERSGGRKGGRLTVDSVGRSHVEWRGGGPLGPLYSACRFFL